MNNPKFENKIKRKITNPASNQAITSGYAIVLSFSAEANTANIQMSKKGGVQLGQCYNNVICPTSIGVQQVNPVAGTPCWVDFHGTTDYFPVITHFFNHNYQVLNYPTQSASVNNTPRYIMGT